MSNRKDLREETRKNWKTSEGQPEISREQIQLGCLLRIADATEIMAKDRVKMEADLNLYKKMYREQREEIRALTASRNTYKGVVTKLKNKIAASKGGNS